MSSVLKEYGLQPESPILVLPYGEKNLVDAESRLIYFALAVTPERKLNPLPEIRNPEENLKTLPITRIISFGNCNVACPYCKRDCQFIDEFGNSNISIPVPIKAIAELMEGAVRRNELIRFSGGDPVVFPKQTLALSEYLTKRHGEKVSIAHNGTGTRWVQRMLPYLSSAAIDLKATPEKISRVMGVAL